MQGILTYHNKFGQLTDLSISKHARDKFLIRWARIYPDEPLSEDSVDDVIATWFSRASQIKQKACLRRKYGDSQYFRINGLTFVVRDSVIVTVLISARGKRYLNGIDTDHPQPLWEQPPSLKPQQPSVPLKKKKIKIVFIPMVHDEE